MNDATKRFYDFIETAQRKLIDYRRETPKEPNTVRISNDDFATLRAADFDATRAVFVPGYLLGKDKRGELFGLDVLIDNSFSAGELQYGYESRLELEEDRFASPYNSPVFTGVGRAPK